LKKSGAKVQLLRQKINILLSKNIFSQKKTVLLQKKLMQILLRKTINPPIPLVALWVVGCALLWFVPAKILPAYIENQNILPLTRLLQTVLPASNIITTIVCLVLSFVNSILLYQLNNIFTIVREKTFVLFLTFFILISAFNSVHYNITANLALTFLLISFFNFLKMYRRTEQTEAAFLSSFLIACIGWLLFPEFLLLFVPVWLGIAQLRAMSLRVFLATLIGMITPAIFCFAIFCFALNQNYFQFFISLFENIGLKWLLVWKNLINFHSIFFVIIFIMWILSLFGIYTNALLNNFRTRTNLNFILIFFISILIILICFPQAFYMFLPILVALFAVFFSHPVTLRTSNFYGIIFIVFCVINAIYVLCNLIANYL